MEASRAILFADVRDSTGLTERLGDEESRRLIGALLSHLSDVTRRHGGRVIKTIGDEIMSVFDGAAQAAAAAADMQRDLSELPAFSSIRPGVGIGFNAGPVVEEGGDVFGDVVIVAARLVARAVAGQILTTADALAGLTDPDFTTRSLGEHRVKGREAPVELVELLWRGETAQLTTVGPRVTDVPRTTLVLRHRGDDVRRASTEGGRIELGRSAECDIVVPTSSASRRHATVSARGGRFYLEDHSTNGTFILQGDGEELVVHRDEVLLVGHGHIRLGDPITEPGEGDIRFEVSASD